MFTFKYKSETKEIESIPSNYKELQALFLSAFGKSDPEKFEFSYKDDEDPYETKIPIQPEQDLFEQAIDIITGSRIPIIYVEDVNKSEINLNPPITESIIIDSQKKIY